MNILLFPLRMGVGALQNVAAPLAGAGVGTFEFLLSPNFDDLFFDEEDEL